MKNLSRYLVSLVTTAWVGGLWAIGYLAVPILFRAQPDKQLAGMLAGEMFSWLGVLGMVCGAILLLQRLIQSGRTALQQRLFQVIAVMLLLTLVQQFVIQPIMADLKLQALPLDVMNSALADRFRMLHGISSIAYLIESLLGVLLVMGTHRPERRYY